MQERNSWPNSQEGANRTIRRNADVSVKEESSGSTPPSGPDSPTVIEFPKASRDRDGAFDNPQAGVGDPEATIAEGMPPPLPSPPAPVVRSVHPPVKPAYLEIGHVLGGRYEIIELLGEGGMGAVYKARDRELDRPVALKTIRPELASRSSTLARFKQELLLSRQVTHKNVIRIYDLGDADGVKFITMEFVEGRDLRSIIREKKKLSPQESVDIMRQVCEGLDAAHSSGVIHRDLKPQNIMEENTGRILVMDFGLARTREGQGMTQTGALVGTLEYMSPEQALGKELDQRSDLFTAGLILYELLTGKMPFSAESALASLIKRTKERAVPVSDLDKTIPGRLSAVVSKCLEQDPGLRYQTANEMLRDLEAWQGKLAGATLRFHPDVKPWGQTIPWPMLAGAVTLLVLAFVAYVLRGRPLSSPARKAEIGPAVSLAVMPFQNASGDASWDWLGSALADMLSTDVGESAHLRRVSIDRVQQVFHDLRISPNSVADPSTLGRVAESINADTLVWGKYSKLGDEIRIDATLQDRKHNRTVRLKSQAAKPSELSPAVDSVAATIRQNLGLSSGLQKELQSQSFQPSSNSLDALRDYTEGLQLLRQGNNLEARKRLGAATKQDPQFAMAYSRLSEADSALGYDNDAEQAGRRAVDLSQNLSPLQRSLIDASLARVVKDNKKAIEDYENLAKSMPENADVELSLGGLYMDTGEYDKARIQLSKLLQADPKNIKVLWQMGGLEIMSGNTEAAFEPLNKALSEAVQSDNQEAKALILQALGVSYRLVNKPDEAMRNYQEAMTINRKLGLKRNMAGNLTEMAVVQNTQGRVDAALAYYGQAIALQREIGMKKEVGDALIDMGVAYQAKGDFDKALNNYQESLQIQRDVGDQSYEALCLSNIGGVYSAKGDTANAITYLQQALQLREKLNDPGSLAETLANLASVYDSTGQFDQALSTSMKALDLWRKAGDARGAAGESHQIGRILLYGGRLGPAISAMQDAVAGFRASSDHGSEMFEVLNDLAGALAQSGRVAESGSLLQEAQDIATGLKNEGLRAELLNTEGNIQRYDEDWKSAKRFYDRAALAATRSADPEQVLISRLHVAEAGMHEGNTGSALREFRNLRQQAESHSLKYRSLVISADIAEAMIRTRDFSHAQQELQAALGNSEKLGARDQSALIHYLLGNAIRLSGNTADARSHYRQAVETIDAIRKDPGADKLLQRPDLKSLYDESVRWSAPGAN